MPTKIYGYLDFTVRNRGFTYPAGKAAFNFLENINRTEEVLSRKKADRGIK